MPPLTAPQFEAWNRRFSRSLEDLEPLYASDGKYARNEVKGRQARVRKATARLRPVTTPKQEVPRRSDARMGYANDKKLLLQVLASDCGCCHHPKGCFHAIFDHYRMGVLDDIIQWRSRSTGTRQADAKQALRSIIVLVPAWGRAGGATER